MRRNNKTKRLILIILNTILFLVNSCQKESTSETDNQDNNGTNLAPIWVFDEIPDLRFAEIDRNGKWAIVASAYKIAYLDLLNKKKLYDLNTSEIDLDYVEKVSISDQGYAVVATTKGIKVFSAQSGIVANFSAVEIGNKTVNVGVLAKISPSGNFYYVNSYLKFAIPNTLLWYNDLDNPNFNSSNDIDVSSNGEFVACASSIYNSPVLLSGDGIIIWKSSYNNDAVNSIKISYDGSKIVLGTLSEITVYDKNNPAPLYRWAHGTWGGSCDCF